MPVLHSNLLSPNLGAISCQQKISDSNFLLVVCRLGRAPWQTKMASGWRGYRWPLGKSGAFRDSAQNRLQTSAEIHMKKLMYTKTILYYVNTFTSLHKKKRKLVSNDYEWIKILYIEFIV
jgi:hypothetical protein